MNYPTKFDHDHDVVIYKLRHMLELIFDLLSHHGIPREIPMSMTRTSLIAYNRLRRLSLTPT